MRTERFKRYRLPLAMIGGTALLVALYMCGGGGGGGGGGSGSSGASDALTVTSRISVVEAQTTTAAAATAVIGGLKTIQPLTMGAHVAAVSDLPSTSDYFTDPSHVYVEEHSTSAFNTVNEILCMVAQTKYDEMLNQGPYKAQIEVGKCKSGQDEASAGGQDSQNQSSGSDAPEYEMWTVESSRADNDAPHVVKAWVHESAKEQEPEKVIFCRAIIAESVSATNPYGLFNMYFQAHPSLNGVVNPSMDLFKGLLKTEKNSAGKVLLYFTSEGGFTTPEGDTYGTTEKATLDKAPDGSSGAGSIYVHDSHPGFGGVQTKEDYFDIAYDAANFLRVGAKGSVCLSRVNFNETAWRYGLYQATSGARVKRNSGFPIKFTGDDGIAYFGYIGYWGMWLPDPAGIESGDVVYRQKFGPSGPSEEPYTVFISRGKLIKNTRKTLTLGEIKNIPLNYNEFNPENPGQPGDQYRVKWNGSSFIKYAKLNQSNYAWENVAEEALGLSALYWPDLNFWSESLGGQVRVQMYNNCQVNEETWRYNCSPTNNTPVIFYAEQTVYPTEAIPTSLSCFDNCPDPSNLTGNFPFFPPVWESGATVSGYQYAFDGNQMVLKYRGAAIVLTGENSSQQYGVRTGPLFEPSAANLAQLACDWDPSKICPWKAGSELDVFYNWETGPNNWNHFTAVKSGDQFVRFEPPLFVEYQHTWPDGGTAKFYLDYSGPGELHGIPGKCVDMNTGEDADCGDGGENKPIRWVPEFTIPDGSAVRDDTGSLYYVKALEKEQRMKKEEGGCSALSTTAYALPSIDQWQDPDIGDEPAVSTGPAVIGGELVEDE